MTKTPSYFSKLLKSERVFTGVEAKNKVLQRVTTGSVALDWALSGGVPIGQLVLFWGPPGSSKTTQALKLVANEQKKYPDKWAIYIDTEYAFDPNRAEEMGIDLERLLVFSSNTFEGAIAPLVKIEDEIKKEKNICAIILDSINGLQSISSEKQMGEGKVESAANAFGGIAKSVNPALTVLNRISAECEILTILTNHANMNLDSMTSRYRPYTLSGGQKLKHLVSVILFLEKPENKASKLFSQQKDNFGNNIAYGSMIRCAVNKSRGCVEGRRAEFAMNLQTGEVEKQGSELVRLGIGLGVLYRNPGKLALHFGDPESGVKAKSEDAFAEMVENDINLFNKIKEACYNVSITSALIVDDMVDQVIEFTDEE